MSKYSVHGAKFSEFNNSLDNFDVSVLTIVNRVVIFI